MADVPENMIIDHEDGPSQSVHRVGKRGLEQEGLEEQEKSALTASTSPDNSAEARKIKKRRVINTQGLMSKGLPPPRLSISKREPASKRYHRGQHVPLAGVNRRERSTAVKKRGEAKDIEMENCSGSVTFPPFVASATLTVRLGGSSKETTSVPELSSLGESLPANRDPQLPDLSVGSINPLKVRSGVVIGSAMPVGPRGFAPVDTTSLAALDLPTSLAGDTSPVLPRGYQSSTSHVPSFPATSVAVTEPLDLPSSFEPQTSPATSVPCQGTLDSVTVGPSSIRNTAVGLTPPEPMEGPVRTQLRRLESAHVVHRPVGPTEPDPREESISLIIEGPAAGVPVSPPVEESIHQVIEQAKDLVTPLAEQLVHPVSAVPTATSTLLRPAHQAASQRFSLPSFQRPTLLDALIKRLRAKRFLMHSWRIADQPSEWQDTPPTRYSLGDLDSNQIYEYLKSGGKSVNALPQPAKEKALSGLTESDVAKSPLLTATFRQKKFTPPRPSLHDTIAKLLALPPAVPSTLATQNIQVMTMVVEQPLPCGAGAGDTSVSSHSEQTRTVESTSAEMSSIVTHHKPDNHGQNPPSLISPVLDEHVSDTQTSHCPSPNVSNGDTLLRPSAEAALLLSRRSYRSHGRLVYLSDKSTSPAFNLPPGSPSNTARSMEAAAHRHRSGLVYLSNNTESAPTTNSTPNNTAGPSSSITQGMSALRHDEEMADLSRQNISPIFSPAINPINSPIPGIVQNTVPEVTQYLEYCAPVERVSTTPMISPTSNSLSLFTHEGNGSAYLQGNRSSLAVLPFGQDKDRQIFTVPGNTAEPPSGPSTLSQRWAVTEEQVSHISRMDVDHEIHGRDSDASRTGDHHEIHERVSTASTTTFPVPASTTEPALGRPNQSHTGELPPSPTTPTPVSSGQRRWRSRQPNTVGQEIPEMLGEMKNVIIDLATSVNGLKDAVSDFRSSQRTPGGFGSAPVQRSGKGKGKARMGGGNSNSGRSHGDTGRESQAQSAGGHVGDDYVADDESRGDDGEGSKNLKLRDDIRKHAVSLLGTPKDGTLTQKVTKADADAFDPLRQIPCTADDFKLHLAGTPAHPWNKAATAVFVQSFCAKFSQYGPEDTENHFKVHLATLIRKYKSQQSLNAKPGAVDEAKAQNRKNTRKASLFAGCMKTIRSIPELQRHESAVGSLGCAGMSSDETSTERGLRVYRIRKKRWRAAEVGTFLHAIDRVTEQTKNITTSRGSTKYHRLPGEKESQEGGIVSGLPINFYSPTWLANLRAHMKPVYDSLNIKHEVYPLVHDQIIQQIAIQNPGLAGFMFR